MNKKSNWDFYGVKIIKQIIIEGDPDFTDLQKSEIDSYVNNNQQLFEESILLVHAQSFDHAYKIAEKKSMEDEISYQNVYKQKVLWKFIDAVDCFLCGEIKSGEEVYACFHTVEKDMTANDFIGKWFNKE